MWNLTNKVMATLFPKLNDALLVMLDFEGKNMRETQNIITIPKPRTPKVFTSIGKMIIVIITTGIGI